MGFLKRAASTLHNSILSNFDRTSIELEKKAKILLYSNFASILSMLFLLVITLLLSEITTTQFILFMVLEGLALLIYCSVILFLAMGKYNLSSQLFIIANMLIGFLASFLRRDNEFGDLYWAICVIAIMAFIATLVAVRAYQVIEVSVTGFFVVLVHFIILPIEGKWAHQIDYLFVAFIFTLFIGFLSLSLFYLTNDSIEIAQRESNNNSIKLSKLKMISRRVPTEYDKLDQAISDFSTQSINTSKEVVSRLNGLDMALKEMVLEMDSVHKHDESVFNKYLEKKEDMSSNGPLFAQSLSLIKDLNQNMIDITHGVSTLNKANKKYMDNFKDEVDQI